MVVVGLGFLAGTGCSDKPESKAQRQLHDSTQKALDDAKDGLFLENVAADGKDASTDPLDEAVSSIDSAISKNRDAKNAVDSATLAKANITFAKAQKLHAVLYEYAVPVSEAGNQIVAINNRIGDLKFQQERLQGLVDSDNERIQKLNDLISGTISEEGLEQKLSNKSAELDKFNKELQTLSSQKQTLLDAASDLQLQADDKLRQAEKAAGQQKVTLSTAGYDLTSQSNHKQIQAQEITNKIQLLQSNIDIVKPLVEKMQTDLAAAKDEVKQISTSSDFSQLKSQLGNVKQQLQKETDNLRAAITQLTNAKSQYHTKADEIIEVLSVASEDYEQVRTSPSREIASEKIAVTSYWKAAVCAEKISVEKNYSSLLESVVPVLQDTGSVSVDSLISSSKILASTMGKTAYENFDLAGEKYSAISGSGAYKTYILKRHILAIYGKLALAEQLGEYDVSDKAAEQIEPLMEEITKSDPDFSRSLTAKLLDGKSDFMPVLQIDNTEYYEGIRANYQSHGWPKLPADQKEAAVRELLANLEKIEKEETFDREAYDSILGSEKQKLVTALEKGFQEEAASSDDPNSF